jgi:oxygen-independent coproporphyrinogen III oxidase
MSGIYIHIPFCRQACNYCDFHFSTSTQTIDLLIASIDRELVLRKNYLQDEIVETIYFGGGTPSLIDTKLIESLLDTVRREFKIHSDPEITLEANPDDLTEVKTYELFQSGINRLSIGIQSFSDEDLKFMNRAHDSNLAITSVMNAKRSGFKNISIDLIYGIQRSLPEQWEKNIDTALSLDVEHLSCYALTIEPRTALADMIRKKKVAPPDDERTTADFEFLMKRSAEVGFEHYEISNFARNKKYSRHNTSYWLGKKYLGVGPSAHSFDTESRQWNVSNNQLYIRSLAENIIPFEKEELSESNKFNEYILTSLRTMWGIDIALVEKEFGPLRKDELLIQVKNFIEDGMIMKAGNNFVLTKKGKFFADGIASELFV